MLKPKRGGNGASQREREGSGVGARREKRKRCIFLPSPSPLSFFRPRTYPYGDYFYSPQSSTVIKSKMAVTTMRTRTRFHPPKIRLHRRLDSKLQSKAREVKPGKTALCCRAFNVFYFMDNSSSLS